LVRFVAAVYACGAVIEFGNPISISRSLEIFQKFVLETVFATDVVAIGQKLIATVVSILLVFVLGDAVVSISSAVIHSRELGALGWW
jgi:hypothetical protein